MSFLGALALVVAATAIVNIGIVVLHAANRARQDDGPAPRWFLVSGGVAVAIVIGLSAGILLH